jgi:hypothetical protein
VLNRFAGGSDVLWNHERRRGRDSADGQ